MSTVTVSRRESFDSTYSEDGGTWRLFKPKTPHICMDWPRNLRTFYDILAICVTVLDILSDLCISYYFWVNFEYTLFWISLSILLFVHISYCVILFEFYTFCIDNLYWKLAISSLLFVLSPIFPFLFFLIDDIDTSPLFAMIHLHRKVPRQSDDDSSKSPLKTWMHSTKMKHIGLITQSLMESSLSLALQLHYSFEYESLYLFDISIALSMTSIAVSLFMFAYNISRLLMAFNYICVVSDFIKFVICITWIYSSSVLFFIWICKLTFVTSVASIYLCFWFVWNKMDLNYDWYQITTNFGRRRSISHSKSLSSHTPNENTYHIHKKPLNSRRRRSGLWRYLFSKCFSNAFLTDFFFIFAFAFCVLLLFPISLLLLDMSSLSLIAFALDKMNTSRFLSVHWFLWQFIFDFLFDSSRIFEFQSAYSHSPTLSQTLSSVSITERSDDLYHLDATELEVKLNTLANSGSANNKRVYGSSRNKNRNKTVQSRKCFSVSDIPWNKKSDLMVRLATVNYIFALHRDSKKLVKYLQNSLANNLLFLDVSYIALRENSNNCQSFYSYIFAKYHRNMIDKWRALSKHAGTMVSWNKKWQLCIKWAGLFIVAPLYFGTQTLFILMPLLRWDILSKIYAFCLFLLLCLTPKIMHFTRVTSHIHYNSILYFTNSEKKIIAQIMELYQNLIATQLRSDLLFQMFGDDVSQLILSYLPEFHQIDDSQINSQINETPKSPKTPKTPKTPGTIQISVTPNTQKKGIYHCSADSNDDHSLNYLSDANTTPNSHANSHASS